MVTSVKFDFGNFRIGRILYEREVIKTMNAVCKVLTVRIRIVCFILFIIHIESMLTVSTQMFVIFGRQCILL